MIGLLQRVSSAKVEIGADTAGAIGRGLMVLVGVERGDTEREADRLVERLIGYRVFPDADRKLNLSVADIGGGLPCSSPSSRFPPIPARARARASRTRRRRTPAGACSNTLAARARARHPVVETGRFGAHMQVTLTNDGPITFTLRVAPPA